jgi:DNA-directed RNA polymerase subunit alpha
LEIKLEESNPAKEPDGSPSLHGRLIVEPLGKGYGLTVGNALRRVLLSSIHGAAIAAVRIDGVLHEFSTVPGVREDVIEILMNLKRVPLRLDSISELDFRSRAPLRLETRGPKLVTAGDILHGPDVEFVNPDAPICTLEEGHSLEMDIYIDSGTGYLSCERPRPTTPNGVQILPVDALLADALFTPVQRVNYAVENENSAEERLVIDLWTNRAMTPKDAVREAAHTVRMYFDNMADDLKWVNVETNPGTGAAKPLDPDVLRMMVHPLGLSIRSENCLQREGITTIGDLVKTTREELLRLKGLGRVSVLEIEKKLDEKFGLKLGENLPPLPPDPLPNHPRLKIAESTPTVGRVTLEPLERGYGMTLGNAMKRVMLSSLRGAAVTAVRPVDFPVSELGLPDEVVRSLHAAGIVMVMDDLIAKTKDELLSVKLRNTESADMSAPVDVLGELGVNTQLMNVIKNNGVGTIGDLVNAQRAGVKLKGAAESSQKKIDDALSALLGGDNAPIFDAESVGRIEAALHERGLDLSRPPEDFSVDDLDIEPSYLNKQVAAALSYVKIHRGGELVAKSRDDLLAMKVENQHVGQGISIDVLNIPDSDGEDKNGGKAAILAALRAEGLDTVDRLVKKRAEELRDVRIKKVDVDSDFPIEELAAAMPDGNAIRILRESDVATAASLVAKTRDDLLALSAPYEVITPETDFPVDMLSIAGDKDAVVDALRYAGVRMVSELIARTRDDLLSIRLPDEQDSEAVDDFPLNELDITPANMKTLILNTLREDRGITSAAGLVASTEKEIRVPKRISGLAIEKIKNALARKGLKLREESTGLNSPIEALSLPTQLLNKIRANGGVNTVADLADARRTGRKLAGVGGNYEKAVDDALKAFSSAMTGKPAFDSSAVDRIEAALREKGLELGGKSNVVGTSVDEIKELPSDKRDALKKSGLLTLGRLAAKTRDELLKIKGIKDAAVNVIEESLKKMGLELGSVPSRAVFDAPDVDRLVAALRARGLNLCGEPAFTANAIELIKRALRERCLNLRDEPVFGADCVNAIENALRRKNPRLALGRPLPSPSPDVLSPFGIISGVKENVMELLMNLKRLPIRSVSDEGMRKLRLAATGPKVVRASDIDLSGDTSIEFIDPDAVLCTLEDGADIALDLFVEHGFGYITAERPRPDHIPAGALMTDAVFSPVLRFSYEVEAARVGQMTDFEKLVMDVRTNGVATPESAMCEAAEIVSRCFGDIEKAMGGWQNTGPLPPRVPTEDLPLSRRTRNALIRAGLHFLDDIIEQWTTGLDGLHGLGAKSREELRDFLDNGLEEYMARARTRPEHVQKPRRRRTKSAEAANEPPKEMEIA